MTQNQIAYLKHLEDRRSHLAAEQQTAIRDTNSYVLGVRQADETERSHRVGEKRDRYELAEKWRQHIVDSGERNRHNTAEEGLKFLDIGEKNRHNVVDEGIKQFHEQEVVDDHIRRWKEDRKQFKAEMEHKQKQLDYDYDKLEQDYMFEKFNQGQQKQKTAQGWISSITKGLSDLGNAASKGANAFSSIAGMVQAAQALPLF